MSVLKKHIFFFVALIYSCSLAFTYVKMEDNIYFWDFNGYWRAWQSLSELLFSHPLQAIYDIKHSIRHDDYNNSPVFIISLFNFLPFSSRVSYVTGLVVAYLMPTVLLFSLLIGKILENKSKLITVLSFIFSVSFPAFWAPTLRGYPDICGLIFILWAVIFCLRNDFSERVDFTKALKLGVLLWAPFLLRRWYAYTIVSLYLTLPILNALYFNGRVEFVKTKKIITSFFLSGMTSVLLALIFQWPLIERIISTDYSYIYSAYQSTLIYSIGNLIDDIGLIFCLMALISFFIVMLIGDNRQRLFLVFSFLNLILSFFLFTRTQSPGVQHNLPFALWILLISCIGMSLSVISLKGCTSKIISAIILMLFLLFSQLQSLFGFLKCNLTPWISNEYFPLRVENFSEYKAMSNDIVNLTRAGRRVSILSSSGVLNDDMLNTISNSKLSERINYASQVDLRDGFRLQTLASDYVIVTDPVQIHLKESGQRVITVPAIDILSNKGIGQAYKKVSRAYKLSTNVNAWIYEKERPFLPSEIEYFFKQLVHYYPEWKNIYSNGIMVTYLSSEISLGDKWGAFNIDSNGVIFAHPGENTPTIIKWKMNGIKSLVIKSLSTSCNIDDDIILRLSPIDLGYIETFYVPKGKGIVLDVEKYQGAYSYFEVSKDKSSGCDSISIAASE